MNFLWAAGYFFLLFRSKWNIFKFFLGVLGGHYLGFLRVEGEPPQPPPPISCMLALYEKSFESSNFWLKKSIFLLFTQVRTLLNFLFKKIFRNWSLLLYELYIHMLFFLWNFIQWMKINIVYWAHMYIFFSIFTMKKLISYVMLSSK